MCLFWPCSGLLFDVVNSSSLFTSMSTECPICHSQVARPSISLQHLHSSLSGCWQINHQNRSHLQTLSSLSQTFHISTVTSVTQLTLLPITLIGSLNIKLNKSCNVIRTSLTCILHWWQRWGEKKTIFPQLCNNALCKSNVTLTKWELNANLTYIGSKY